jgi:hypothetical protein
VPGDAAGPPGSCILGGVDAEISAYYARGQEAQRLSRGASRVEQSRTREVLGRWLGPPPGVVLDVGGGPGG